MKILVIAGKDVGLACVRHLVNTVPTDTYTFIACDPGASEISAYLASAGYECSTNTMQALSAVASQPAGQYDWLLNLWGGVILKPDILTRARRSLNIHPGYLPHGRGRDPVVWAIRNQDLAGLALHSVTDRIDEGPVWCRECIDYVLPCKGAELYERVISRCSELFMEHWLELRETTSEPTPQEPGHPTMRRKDLLADRDVDLDHDSAARDLVLRLLAHDFGPEYTARIRLNGKLFDATLNLTPAKEDETDHGQ